MALALLTLSLLASAFGALATASALIFAAAFLELIAPPLVAIGEDVNRLNRDFRFITTRLRLGLPIMGEY